MFPRRRSPPEAHAAEATAAVPAAQLQARLQARLRGRARRPGACQAGAETPQAPRPSLPQGKPQEASPAAAAPALLAPAAPAAAPAASPARRATQQRHQPREQQPRAAAGPRRPRESTLQRFQSRGLRRRKLSGNGSQLKHRPHVPEPKERAITNSFAAFKRAANAPRGRVSFPLARSWAAAQSASEGPRRSAAGAAARAGEDSEWG